MSKVAAEEIIRERIEIQRDYRRVVITQTILIITALLLSDAVDLLGFNEHRELFFSLFLIIGGVYYYLLWDLLRNFNHHPVVVKAVLWLLIIDFAVLTIVEFPFFKIVDNPRAYLLVLHSVLLGTEVFVMTYVFKDIFTSGAVSFEKLWGSVALFLMMAIAFASVFDLIVFMQPNSLGITVEPGFPSFVESLYLSLVTISGGTAALPAVSHLIRNVSAVEGVWGTLYLVILIGRIIGRV